MLSLEVVRLPVTDFDTHDSVGAREANNLRINHQRRTEGGAT
jgi:hypothetical protein